MSSIDLAQFHAHNRDEPNQLTRFLDGYSRAAATIFGSRQVDGSAIIRQNDAIRRLGTDTTDNAVPDITQDGGRVAL
ncbi:MAG: hypothetical protein JSR61_08115 [Proteobacteria bacterium]|nr:hypothetical protein [Pseudomonadota bacterium]